MLLAHSPQPSVSSREACPNSFAHHLRALSLFLSVSCVRESCVQSRGSKEMSAGMEGSFVPVCVRASMHACLYESVGKGSQAMHAFRRACIHKGTYRIEGLALPNRSLHSLVALLRAVVNVARAQLFRERLGVSPDAHAPLSGRERRPQCSLFLRDGGADGEHVPSTVGAAVPPLQCEKGIFLALMEGNPKNGSTKRQRSSLLSPRTHRHRHRRTGIHSPILNQQRSKRRERGGGEGLTTKP